jgi:hypothetical protein
MTQENKKSAKAHRAGKGSVMYMKTPVKGASIGESVDAEIAVFGKPFSRQRLDTSGLSPSLFDTTDDLTASEQAEASLSPDTCNRGGAITVQPSVAHQGAWRIAPCGDRVCVSVLFQRGLAENMRYVRPQDRKPWDRPEYAERISLFFDRADWSQHAPVLLDGMRNWLSVVSSSPFASGQHRLRFSVSERREQNFPAQANCLRNAIKTDAKVSVEAAHDDTLDLTRSVLQALPNGDRSNVTINVNWMTYGADAHVNIHASSPDLTTNPERLARRIDAIDQSRNMTAEDTMQSALAIENCSGATADRCFELTDRSRLPHLSSAYFSDAVFCQILDNFFAIASAVDAPWLPDYLESRFQPSLFSCFDMSEILPTSAWNAIARSGRDLPRMMGLCLLHADPIYSIRLGANLILLNARKETSGLEEKLSEVLVSAQHWKRSMWQASYRDTYHLARAQGIIRKVVSANRLPKDMRIAADTLLSQNLRTEPTQLHTTPVNQSQPQSRLKTLLAAYL